MVFKLSKKSIKISLAWLRSMVERDYCQWWVWPRWVRWLGRTVFFNFNGRDFRPIGLSKRTFLSRNSSSIPSRDNFCHANFFSVLLNRGGTRVFPLLLFTPNFSFWCCHCWTLFHPLSIFNKELSFLIRAFWEWGFVFLCMSHLINCGRWSFPNWFRGRY